MKGNSLLPRRVTFRELEVLALMHGGVKSVEPEPEPAAAAMPVGRARTSAPRRRSVPTQRRGGRGAAGVRRRSRTAEGPPGDDDGEGPARAAWAALARLIVDDLRAA
jgi:hypothetical protein